MKKLFFALCAVAALASCSKEEVVSYDKGEVIGFANPFVNKSTRAAIDPSYSGDGTITGFKVWGTANDVAIYAGDDVAQSSGVWTCANPVNYWIEDTQYKFAAVANAKTVDCNSTDFPVTATFDATAAANVDLVYAPIVSQTGHAAGSNTAVPLVFNHLLSKVKFTVNVADASADNYSFVVRDITVKGAHTGTVTLATGVWSSLGEDTAYTDFDIVVGDTDDDVECAQELLLIPDEISISFEVDIKYNGETINTKPYGTSPLIKKTIVAGNAYNFIIGVSLGDPITFDVDYTLWDETGNTSNLN